MTAGSVPRRGVGSRVPSSSGVSLLRIRASYRSIPLTVTDEEAPVHRLSVDERGLGQ